MLEHLSPLELKIYLLKERHPEMPVYKISKIAGASPIRVSRILRKLGMNGVDIFTPQECRYMEKLSIQDRIHHLNIHWKAIPYEYHHLLNDIPLHDLVPIHRFQKILFRIEMKTDEPHMLIALIDDLLREYERDRLLYSYFHLLSLKMLLYNLTGRKEETLKLYEKHKDTIRKLPYHLLNEYNTLVLNAALHLGNRSLASQILHQLERYINSRRGKEDENVREYVVDAFIVMGNYLKALQYAEKNPLKRYRLLRFTGRYGEMLRMEVPSPPTFLEKFFLTLDKSYALLFTGSPVKALLNLLPIYSRLENKYPVAMRNFHIFMAAYNAVLENKSEMEKHLIEALNLSEGYIRTLIRAFLYGGVEEHLWYRDIRLVKDWIEGRIGRAVERARKYGGMWMLHMVALFHPKSIIRIHRYKELEPVLGLMKMPILRLNIFNVQPIIHFMGNRIPLGRSKSARMLIKLILEGGEMEDSRMESKTAREINRLLGKKILVKEGNVYRLRARLRSDYFRFMELYRYAIFSRNNEMWDEYHKAVSRMKRILRCIPFNRLSLIDRELDDYRTSIKVMMEEVLK